MGFCFIQNQWELENLTQGPLLDSGSMGSLIGSEDRLKRPLPNWFFGVPLRTWYALKGQFRWRINTVLNELLARKRGVSKRRRHQNLEPTGALVIVRLLCKRGRQKLQHVLLGFW